MTPLLQRREVLQGMLGGAAALILVPSLRAASSQPGTMLASNISLLKIGAVNVVVVVTERDVVLIDTGPKENAPDLVEQLLALATSTNYTLFNTHWHSDQTGANSVFLRMHSRIIAHERARERLSTILDSPSAEPWRYDDLPGQAYKNGVLQIADEIIEYRYLPRGHTDGDMYIYLRNANIMAVGDMVAPARDPELDAYGGGWLGGRVDAMDMLLQASNDSTRFVPSYGPVVAKAQVKAERDMMAFLYEKLVEQIRMGFTAKDSFASGVMNGLGRTFDNPRKFLNDAHYSLRVRSGNLAPNVAQA